MSVPTPTPAASTPRIPVTVLTGFLGSGKTTLVNHILTADHGHRIAVIENEFGEIPIDDALVLSGEEEIIEMSNGCCLCCTARTDLIEILRSLVVRGDLLTVSAQGVKANDLKTLANAGWAGFPTPQPTPIPVDGGPVPSGAAVGIK